MKLVIIHYWLKKYKYFIELLFAMYSFKAKFSAHGIAHTDLPICLHTRIGTEKWGGFVWKLVIGHTVI